MMKNRVCEPVEDEKRLFFTHNVADMTVATDATLRKDWRHSSIADVFLERLAATQAVLIVAPR